MRLSTAPIEPAAEAPLLPDLGERGRYQVSVTLWLENATTRTDDLDAARASLADFAALHAGDKEAHGAIYDFATLKQIDRFWGQPKREKPENPMIALYERAIAVGAPVTVIAGGKRADFNVGAGK